MGRMDLRALAHLLLQPHNTRRHTRSDTRIFDVIVEAKNVSPDGEWIAFDSNLRGTQDIYVQRLAGGEARRVTTDLGNDFHPDFSPDGRELVFHSTRHGSRDLFLIGVDGTGEVRLTDEPGDEMNPEFSPDGLSILYREEGFGGVGLITRDEVGGRWSDPRLLMTNAGNADWSPDGQNIVFVGRLGLGVASLDSDRRILLGSEESGLRQFASPVWSDDGTIYFAATIADDARGMYGIDTAGGPPRLVVRFDDPAKIVQFNTSLSHGIMYLSVTEYESDIYAMDIEY